MEMTTYSSCFKRNYLYHRLNGTTQTSGTSVTTISSA